MKKLLFLACLFSMNFVFSQTKKPYVNKKSKDKSSSYWKKVPRGPIFLDSVDVTGCVWQVINRVEMKRIVDSTMDYESRLKKSKNDNSSPGYKTYHKSGY